MTDFTYAANGLLYDRNTGAFVGFVDAKGREMPISRLTSALTGTRVAVVGDSFAFQSNGGFVGGLTLTRSNGVVTVAGATGHNFYPGSTCSVVGCANFSDEVVRAPVQSYVSSSSFTYLSAGPDGPIAAASTGISIQANQIQQFAGFFTHLNRLSGGAYRLVANCGFPGATTPAIAPRVSKFVTPFTPDRVFGFTGYNDINGGLAVSDTVNGWLACVDACPTALWEIFAPWPFNSGAAANTAANLRKLTRYYQALKEAMRNRPNVRVHNSPVLFTNRSTGLANTGYIKTVADQIHPTPRAMYELAQYYVALDTTKPTPVPLPVNNLDTRANDSASAHVLDNPMLTGSGGSALTNTTGTVPDGCSGAFTGTGATGATSAVSARADGSNDWVLTYTPANADNSMRASISLTTSRFPSGGVIDKLVAKFSISGFASNNAANLKSAQMNVVFIADGVTYAGAAQEASSVTETAAACPQTDLTDVYLVLRDIPIPVYSSLTTVRLDFTTQHYAAGTQVVMKINSPDVELAQ